MPLNAFVRDGVLVLQIGDVITGDTFDRFFGIGIGAQDVQEALVEFSDADALEVQLNSPGGSVAEGTTIFNALRLDRRPVTTRVMGMAASIAGVIAMAGDEVVVETGALLMVHNPRVTMFDAEASDLRDGAEFLDKVSSSVVDIYLTKAETNRPGEEGLRAEVEGLVEAETWLTASEAVDVGLADTVGTAAEAPPAEATAEWNLRRGAILAQYEHAPAAAANGAPLGWSGPTRSRLLDAVASARRSGVSLAQQLQATARVARPPTPARNVGGHEGQPMDPETLKALGLDVGATPEQISAAIKANQIALAEANAQMQKSAEARVLAEAEARAAEQVAHQAAVTALKKKAIRNVHDQIDALAWTKDGDELVPSPSGLEQIAALVEKNPTLQRSNYQGPAVTAVTTNTSDDGETDVEAGDDDDGSIVYHWGNSRVDLTHLTGLTNQEVAAHAAASKKKHTVLARQIVTGI